MSKKVYLSPSDQTNNKYAYGDTTEAIQCGRIAEACKNALERCGISVMVGQYDSMKNRCAAADNFGANLYIPIHTNAFNGVVTGTRMFASSTTGEGYKAAQKIFNYLAPLTPGTSENISVNNRLYEIRTPKAPTAYIECEFHDVVSTAKWIIDNVVAIGEAIAHGVCDYFGIAYVAPGNNNPAPTPTPSGSNKKSIEEVARDVIAGKYGNGEARVIALTNAGYNYNEVQNKVNEILSGGNTNSFNSYRIKVAVDALNIRSGPSINYSITGCIYDHGVYTIVDESAGAGSVKGWGKLKSGVGWIALDYCNRI